MDITGQHSVTSPSRKNEWRSHARAQSVQESSLKGSQREFFFEHIKHAISAHNSQPFNVSLGSNQILISVDRSRELLVADPNGKDLALSLGALIECIDLTLNYLGYEIEGFEADIESAPAARLVFSKLDRPRINTEKLFLFELMKIRQSYRKPYSETRFDLPTLPAIEGASVSQDKAVISKIAKLYDDVNIKFLRKKGYLKELNEWLRFSPNHLRYSEDGLNKEAMGLSDIEASLGKAFFGGATFKVLSTFGLDRLIFSEASKLKSAQFMIAIHADKETSLIDQGRLFFRVWIRVTHYRLFGAPLSLLTDDQEATRTIEELFETPEDRVLVNVLSLGVVDWSIAKYKRARRNLEDSNNV